MTPPGWRCTKRVGFLFPHPCERVTPAGCPDCRNGQIDDPYRSRSDRYGYSESDYDSYNAGEVGPLAFAFAGGDSGGAGASADFSEADGESLVTADDGFEDDLSAS